MGEKVIKQINTSCPFPLLVYKTNVTYDEVRKASGIAFILLELIEKSTGTRETISDVLKKFGIPADLHYIFGKELAGLISTDIINSSYDKVDYFLSPKYFPLIKVSDITLSDKGKKMFKEGAIPTGAEKTKSVNIFFDPVTRKFDLVWNQPFIDIGSSILGEDFLDKVDIDISGLEDYIVSNTMKIGLKAEERVIKVETEEPDKKRTGADGNMNINITANGAEFTFTTTSEKAFFNRYYSSEMMKNIMLIKTKYKFVNANKEPVNVPTVSFKGLSVSNLYIPDDIQRQANRPCKVFIARGMLGYNRSDNAIKIEGDKASSLLNKFDTGVEFALFDNSGCKYYRALNIVFPCLNFGDTFEMQFLVESIASADSVKEVLDGLFSEYKQEPWSSDVGKIILYIASELCSPDYLKRFAESKLDEVKTPDEKSAVLLKLNESFQKSEEWKVYFVEFANGLFADSIAEIQLNNMIYKNIVLTPLKDAIGMNNSEYIAEFVKNIKDKEEPNLLYQALEAAEFPTHEILGVVNIVETYMQAVLNNGTITGDNTLASKYKVLQTNLWKLNDMLGITSYNEYTIKEDYNANDFFDIYSTLQTSYTNLKEYNQYAVDEYRKLEQYFDIYEPIHELLSIEKTSASHPEKLTKKYIDEQIAHGKYKDAICDLLVKLQFDLRNKLKNSETSADKLINIARAEKLIDKEQADSLHKLRMCRNDFQHPGNRQPHYNKQMIEEWRDIVFMISEEEK